MHSHVRPGVSLAKNKKSLFSFSTMAAATVNFFAYCNTFDPFADEYRAVDGLPVDDANTRAEDVELRTLASHLFAQHALSHRNGWAAVQQASVDGRLAVHIYHNDDDDNPTVVAPWRGESLPVPAGGLVVVEMRLATRTVLLFEHDVTAYPRDHHPFAAFQTLTLPCPDATAPYEMVRDDDDDDDVLRPYAATDAAPLAAPGPAPVPWSVQWRTANVDWLVTVRSPRTVAIFGVADGLLSTNKGVVLRLNDDEDTLVGEAEEDAGVFIDHAPRAGDVVAAAAHAILRVRESRDGAARGAVDVDGAQLPEGAVLRRME